MISKLLSSTLFRLLAAVVIGLTAGNFVGAEFIAVVVAVKYIAGQLIFFMVPLIILSFISSSIAKMGGIASRMLALSLLLAYGSSVGQPLWQWDWATISCRGSLWVTPWRG